MSPSSVLLGVSLKMYFDHNRTRSWCTEVAELARRHESLVSGAVTLVVLPGFTSLATTVEIFTGTGVLVGAQDLFWEDRGAFTGEVSGADLTDVGCTFVEIGHAERRALFGEGPAVIAKKLAAAARNGLTPILCVGEASLGTPREAAQACIEQLNASLIEISPTDRGMQIVVAYEPEWAIGAAEPAQADYVAAVAVLLRDWLATRLGEGSARVIYGGSAKPGLLSELGGSVDGLFLGRFAHDATALRQILDEAAARSHQHANLK
ncbi:triose-phosphate isomerase family protein [Cryobacterium serini]|uniref:Triosephosphate isomerase n=1 Tax=Cryobacterium serini TaxID=1259201 RepID=A0A4R9BUH3_9MICO|nr:triose-phosphate isomerase family protein [Cryobacterium serini]TFD90752.1 triosephosphate isomerase [Cryobacterium serini]